MKVKLICSLMAAALMLAQPADASKREFKKSVRYEFNIDQNTLLEIVNRNGNIVIENTDDDHVTIEATITGRGDSDSEAEKVCTRIDLSAVMVNNKITVGAEVPQSLKYDDFDLSYAIVMPAYTNINLSNKYGNVVADCLQGKTTLKVSYGSLKIKRLDDKTGGFPVVELAYSRESEISEMNIGGINVSYPGITVDHGQAVAVSSKYSKLMLGEVASMAIESAYDNISIANAEKIDLSTRYTKVNVGFLKQMASIDIEYGSISIGGVGHNFKNIGVNAKYTDTDIDLVGMRNYSFDLKTKYGNITTPNRNLVYQEQALHDGYKTAKGRSGNANEGGKITVSAKYGNIKVKNDK